MREEWAPLLPTQNSHVSEHSSLFIKNLLQPLEQLLLPVSLAGHPLFLQQFALGIVLTEWHKVHNMVLNYFGIGSLTDQILSVVILTIIAILVGNL